MSRAERWAVIVVAIVAAAAAIAGLDARATYGARVTADEPQYLLTAQSLGDDLSLDISDEIAKRAYLPYHEVPIDRQTSVLPSGREISPHDPGLPALLALPMAVGGWALAKAALAALGAATAALATWVAMHRFSVAPVTAGITLASVFAGIPLAAYGTQVYPEIPAALCVVTAFAALTAPGPTRRRTALAIAAIVALPWLAVKYAPVAAVLAVALLATLPDRRRRLVATAWLAAAGAAFVWLHHIWYGGWTAYGTGDHFEQTGEFSAIGTDVDLLGRSRRLAGLLVDREFGIAAWSPVWLLLPVAAAVVVRRRPVGWRVWAAVVAAGWLNATFVALTMHGWWVPGRQIVVILPVAAVGIALLADRSRPLVAAVAVGGVFGAVNWVWLAVEASSGRRTLVVDFMQTAAAPYRWWRAVLPSGLDAAPADTALLVAWSVALLLATVSPWWWTRRSPAQPR